MWTVDAVFQVFHDADMLGTCMHEYTTLHTHLYVLTSHMHAPTFHSQLWSTIYICILVFKFAEGVMTYEVLLFFHHIHCIGVPISEQEECDPQKDGHLYAMNGSDSSEGRLEVCHERSIRNVCDLKLNFSMINADVACYQLGFAGAKDVVNNGTAFGRSTTDQAWLANLQCNGLEERLKDCNPAGWYKGNDCSVGTAVGVRCNSK